MRAYCHPFDTKHHIGNQMQTLTKAQILALLRKAELAAYRNGNSK